MQGVEEGLERGSDMTQTHPTPGHGSMYQHVAPRTAKGHSADTSTTQGEAGCRDTAPHNLLLTGPGQTPKITTKLTLHQRWEHIWCVYSPSFPTTSSLCPSPGRHGCSGLRDEGSPESQHLGDAVLAGMSSACPVEDAFAPLS